MIKLNDLFILWLVLVICASTPAAHGDISFTTLVSFNGTNGANPYAGVIQGADGNFYGTTSGGGASNKGTVFEMTSSGVISNLFSFAGTNGANPIAALIQTKSSNFYGTTYHGGSNDNGTIFSFGGGSMQTLFRFDGAAGAWPHAGLVQGADGFFYGTTAIGGTNNAGTVYRIAADGTFSNLVSFYTNGFSPYAGLVQGFDGNFYGTTFQGGAEGQGTMFKVNSAGAMSSIYSFSGSNDGGFPDAALIQDAGGFLYGTTYYGGSNGWGAVFRLATNGTISNLFSFSNTNGAYPEAGLLLGSDGFFYGTTQSGGIYTNASGSGYGTLYRLTTNFEFTTLLSFDSTNGASPQCLLLQGNDGKIYGTTESGGANDLGTVFSFTTSSGVAPEFESAVISNTNILLTWTATAGRTYQMAYKTNLLGGLWMNLGGNIVATNALMTTLDTFGPDTQRFYRVFLLP